MTGHWSFTILRIVAILFALGQIWMNLALGAIGGSIYWPGMVEQIVIFAAGPVAIFAGHNSSFGTNARITSNSCFRHSRSRF